MTFLANYRAQRRKLAELNAQLVVLTVANEFAAQHPLSSFVGSSGEPAGLIRRLAGFDSRACTQFSAREHTQTKHIGVCEDDWVRPAPRNNFPTVTEGAAAIPRKGCAAEQPAARVGNL